MAKSLDSIAEEASRKAKAKGTEEAHRDAAAAHDRAAVFAKNEGDQDKAADHADAANKHRKKAKQSGDVADSSSGVSAEDNPMLTWMNKKQQ